MCDPCQIGKVEGMEVLQPPTGQKAAAAAKALRLATLMQHVAV
jgi:hypothetical protein